MIVFNNFFKLVKANINSILLYALIFIGFGVFTSSMGGTTTEFVATKPNVAIINNSDSKLANSFVKYISEKAVVKEIEESEIDDSLFYREIEYVFYIAEDFSLDSKIDTKKIPGSTSAMYIEMLFNRYLNVVATYVENGVSEEKALDLINADLAHESEVNIVVDESATIAMANYYFNFSNYAIVAILIFSISTIIMAFKKDAVNKRNRISSMSYKEINKQLFMASSVLSFILFVVVMLFSLIFFSKAMLNIGGLLIAFNLFIFIFTIQSFSLFVAHFIKTRDALTGVVNITALGSSFISGAFVPQFILGPFVVGLSTIFPSYYFITNNNIIAELSNYSLANLTEYFIHICFMFIFMIIFYVLGNYISKRRE